MGARAKRPGHEGLHLDREGAFLPPYPPPICDFVPAPAPCKRHTIARCGVVLRLRHGSQAKSVSYSATNMQEFFTKLRLLGAENSKNDDDENGSVCRGAWARITTDRLYHVSYTLARS